MKNFLAGLFFSLTCLVVNGQQQRFIYLQSENSQPFFVKQNNKILNSYPSGYVIIPKLDDGSYNFVIGFSGNMSGQAFIIPINKDAGFTIKAADANQLQLINLQTHEIINGNEVASQPDTAYEKATDPFSILLANAVNDSTILRKDVAKNIIIETNQKDSNNITAINSVTTNVIESIKSDSAKTDVVSNQIKTDSLKRETVILIPEKNENTKLTDSSQLITAVKINTPVSENNADTNSIAKQMTEENPSEKLNQKDSVITIASNTDIAINKPAKKRKTKKNVIRDTEEQKSDIVKNEDLINNHIDSTQSNSENELVLVKSVIKRKQKKTTKEGLEMMYVDAIGKVKDTIRVLIPIDRLQKEVKTEPDNSIADMPDQSQQSNAEKSKSITDDEKKIIEEAKKDILKSAMINSDCKNFATENDFLKIRKKMVAEDNDDDMIKAAKKIFKTRCFTTEQIKNLGTLFLKDEGKYSFFETAYPFVSDSDLYYTLENQMSDNYYITRFKAMIHK